MSTFEQKISISAQSALTFALVNHPNTYKMTSNLTGLNLFDPSTNCPTYLGLLAHALVFFCATFMSMGDPNVKTWIKVKHSLYGTLIFFLISNPAMYSLTGSLFGSDIADSNGCPTLMGVGLHALVYFGALVAVMYLPDEDN